MSPTGIALIIFACVFGAAVFGMFLRVVMPESHLNEDSKDVIKLGLGLIATITALVLGLMISTTKGSFDQQDAAVKHSAAKLIMLDRVLAQYGPETKEIRDLLRRAVADRVEEIWPEERSQPAQVDETKAAIPGAGIEGRIRQLMPQNDVQRGIQAQALQFVSDIMETQWLVRGAVGSSVPLPFLVVVGFWLTFIFVCFGIFSPRNITVVAVLFICALSVAGSLFLILEMDEPLSGMMKISSAPLRHAISLLGQ